MQESLKRSQKDSSQSINQNSNHPSVDGVTQFEDNREEFVAQRKLLNDIPHQTSILDNLHSTDIGNNSTNSQFSIGSKNQSNHTAQLERKYDENLSGDKVKLMEWFFEKNKSLGISQEGQDKSGSKEGVEKNKKSNFSWHHIVAFSDLSEFGEGKKDPANHGGNLRLGPNKNRSEPNDVSGGTALDPGYLPLDQDGEIVLDEYSKKILDGTIKIDQENSVKGELTSETYNITPQTKNFEEGKEADAFSEWFFDSDKQKVLLSDQAITSKLNGAKNEDIKEFIANINSQLDSRRRTYKYYNKKKEVQTKSGVPITDISEGTFSHLTIKKGEGGETVSASRIIDELLRDEEWISRGSQGKLLDVSTTYKFGLSELPAFTKIIEDLVAEIDLSDYGKAKLIQFSGAVSQSFGKLKDSDSRNAKFSQDSEVLLIKKLEGNLSKAENYDGLWKDVEENDIKDQYVKAVEIDDDWILPVPSTNNRRNIIINTNSKEHYEVSDAWALEFVKELANWDKKTPLFDSEFDLINSNSLYIDFDDVEDSIEENESTWKMKEINEERQKIKNQMLPAKFIEEKLTIESVKNSIFTAIEAKKNSYISNVKDDLSLNELKSKLKNEVNGHFNVFSKYLKGLETDFAKRKTAFGGNLDGYVNNLKWNLINILELPEVEGLDNKKWSELGDLQTKLFEEWVKQRNVIDQAKTRATTKSLEKFLP